MNLKQINKHTKVFVAGHLGSNKNKILAILESAGMQVLLAKDTDDAIEKLNMADCSLHILANSYSEFSNEQFQMARKKNQRKENFKIFIWQSPEIFEKEIEPEQSDFIRIVRNNIYNNMIFSNQESMLMLVEDIRSIMEEEIADELDLNKADIFFIYNEIDEDAVGAVTNIIEDVASVEKLSIILNNKTDYARLVAMQMKKSVVTVIFYKRSVDWALPFTQQVWKNMGGASAPSKILLIGDANHEQNINVNFDAPNVSSLTVAQELLPLEIIVQFDQIKSLSK